MLASRTSCTNFGQSGSLTGAGAPLEHTRPGINSRLADSASASEAFSIACQPPKVLFRGSVAIPGSRSCFTFAGFSNCGKNTTLAAGYRTPRISWFKLAYTLCVTVDGVWAVNDSPGAASIRESVTKILRMRVD